VISKACRGENDEKAFYAAKYNKFARGKIKHTKLKHPLILPFAK
jgi:hypothetical protein